MELVRQPSVGDARVVVVATEERRSRPTNTSDNEKKAEDDTTTTSTGGTGGDQEEGDQEEGKGDFHSLAEVAKRVGNTTVKGCGNNSVVVEEGNEITTTTSQQSSIRVNQNDLGRAGVEAVEEDLREKSVLANHPRIDDVPDLDAREKGRANRIAEYCCSDAAEEDRADPTVPRLIPSRSPQQTVDSWGGVVSSPPSPPPVPQTQPGAFPQRGINHTTSLATDVVESDGLGGYQMQVSSFYPPDEEEGPSPRPPGYEEPSPRPPPPAHDNIDDLLVQAQPIEDDDSAIIMERAEPVPAEEHKQSAKRSSGKREGGRKYAVLVILCVFLGVIVLFLALFLQQQSKKDEAELEPYNTTNDDDVLDNSTILEEDLLPWSWDLPFSIPNSTLQAIIIGDPNNNNNNNQTTPQYQAYQWMKKDPYLSTYTGDRLLQRFVLATFYYTLGGHQWTYQGGGDTISYKVGGGASNELTFYNITSEPWLSYDHSECEWFSAAEAREGIPACSNGTTTFAVMSIQENRLIGTMPEELSLLSSLEVLDLGRNYVEGTIPTGIFRLPNLWKLALHKNQFQGAIPSPMGKLSNSLTFLLLVENQFTGMLPSEICQLTKLTALHLSDNKLSGSLPTEMGLHLTNLQSFRMARNQLTGTLPSTLGLLNNTLEETFFHSNQLTGQLPSQLGQIKKFFAPYNQFSGTLPSEFSAGVQFLNLIGNQDIHGTVPESWGKFAVLKLKGTSLSGTIPESVCQTRKLEFDCEPLCGCGGDCQCQNITL